MDYGYLPFNTVRSLQNLWMVWRSVTIEFHMFHRNFSIKTSFRHDKAHTWSSPCWHFTLAQRLVSLGRIASSRRTTWMSKTLWKELLATVLKCKSSTNLLILFVSLLLFIKNYLNLLRPIFLFSSVSSSWATWPYEWPSGQNECENSWGTDIKYLVDRGSKLWSVTQLRSRCLSKTQPKARFWKIYYIYNLQYTYRTTVLSY